MTGERALDRRANSRIDSAFRHGEVIIPIICVWELGMLQMKGRIRFHEPLEDWVSKSLALPGVHLASLTPDIALLCHRLPGKLHGDPADRLIVATAIALDATLVTRDKGLLAYGARGHVKVLAA